LEVLPAFPFFRNLEKVRIASGQMTDMAFIKLFTKLDLWGFCIYIILLVFFMIQNKKITHNPKLRPIQNDPNWSIARRMRPFGPGCIL
jgi:hypothetical protein